MQGRIIDYYGETNRSGSFAIYNSYKFSQSFTGDDGILNSVKFYLDKSAVASGSVYAKIYSHSGTFGTSSIPTGSALAISEPLSVSSIVTGLNELIFLGDNKIQLVDSTNYCVVLEFLGEDYITIGFDSTSPTHSGNSARYTTSWTTYPSYDTVFYVYADKVYKYHTIDGYVKGTQTKTHTIDGTVEDSEAGDPIRQEDGFFILQEDGIGRILDQSNLQSPEITNTIDAIVKETFTETHSIDAIVKVRDNEETHTIDAIVKETFTETHTTDAIVKETKTKTNTLDAYVRDTLTETHTVDGIVVETKTATHTIDGIVKEIKTKTHTVDGIVKATQTETCTIDGVVSAVKNSTHTIDGYVKATNQKTFTLDAIVKASLAKTSTIDGYVRDTLTKTFVVDAIVEDEPFNLKIRQEDNFYIQQEDGSFIEIEGIGVGKLHSIDGYVRDTFLETHSIDAIVVERKSETHTVDGITIERRLKTHSIDAIVKGTNTAQFTITGRIKIDWRTTTKPTTSYTGIDKPTTNYTGIDKPTTNYNSISKPITNYTSRSKPSTIWTDVERPV